MSKNPIVQCLQKKGGGEILSGKQTVRHTTRQGGGQAREAAKAGRSNFSPPVARVPVYSWRRATMGSTRMARRAGT
jgi:hypothetical protein